MNAINVALTDIRFNIPADILFIGFMEGYSDTVNQIISLDERIVQKVIRPRVMRDCNLIGGIDAKINLKTAQIDYLGYNNEYIIRISKGMTQGKSILRALELLSNVNYGFNYPGVNSVSTTATVSKMYNNLAHHNLIQTSRLELVGENTILVADPSVFLYNCVMRVVLAYDDNMSSLNVRAFPMFSHACILAVKAYIYNTLKVKLDQGYVYGGHELSTITEIVNEYSDANEQYDEYLKMVLRKVLFMQQPDTMNRYVKAMFGNSI